MSHPDEAQRGGISSLLQLISEFVVAGRLSSLSASLLFIYKWYFNCHLAAAQVNRPFHPHSDILPDFVKTSQQEQREYFYVSSVYSLCKAE